MEEVNTLLYSPADYYVFPALRGIQAGREYYVAMCRMGLIPKIFLFDEEEIPPDLRAQRVLNKGRVPEIARYLYENEENYVLSSITASIDGDVKFLPFENAKEGNKIGKLAIPMDAKILINDGQHRRAAIEEAIKENPKLANETISVVFYIDGGLKRSQQMFADLNQHAVRASKSLEILYDHRDEMAILTRELANKIPIFKNKTEFEKTSIPLRSLKVFTLSSIYHGTKSLLGKNSKHYTVSDYEWELTYDFWKEITENIPEWKLLVKSKASPKELRTNYVHVHGVFLQALGRAGYQLVKEYPAEWKGKLQVLNEIDWSRNNPEWEGRAMHQGKLSKSINNIKLTANLLKQRFDLHLSRDEQSLEESLNNNEGVS